MHVIVVLCLFACAHDEGLVNYKTVDHFCNINLKRPNERQLNILCDLSFRLLT